MNVPEEVVHLLARHGSSIREQYGCILQVKALSASKEVWVYMPLAEETLRDIIGLFQ